MEIILNVLLLLLGFVMLVKGADIFVDGSSNVAKILKVPSIIVGLTVVSMGTSLPELAVSTTAALNGSNEIALSNVIGSNFFNLMVVLGMSAVIAKKAVPVQKSLLVVEFPLNLVMTLLVGYFAVDVLLGAGQPADLLFSVFDQSQATVMTGTLERKEGIILMGVFVAYMIYTIIQALVARKGNTDEDNEKKPSIVKAIVFIVLGVVLIKFGGDFVVKGAKVIAAWAGMSETLIGLTIVACGTSLPELVTSVVAAKKDECDLAVGNVIGSNLFNLLLILGVSATIHPVAVISSSIADLLILAVMGLMTYIICIRGKNVNKIEGALMVLAYIAYLAYIILR